MIIEDIWKQALVRKNYDVIKTSLRTFPNAADADLLGKIEYGDREAMRHLYSRYLHLLNAFIDTCLINCKKRSEILHNSFLDIWRGKKVWNRQQSVKVFILTIVRKKIEKLNEQTKKNLSHNNNNRYSKKMSKQLQETDNRRQGHTILSHQHRRLLFLIYNENLSYDQVSVIENCSPETVKKRFLDTLMHIKCRPLNTPRNEVQLSSV